MDTLPICLTYVDVTHREDLALVVIGLCTQSHG